MLTINFIIAGDKTKTELARYIHTCRFSPCIKTLKQAIARGILISWPVEKLNFSKLIKTSIATEKGHLDQERKYLNLTKNININLHDNFPEKILKK